MFRKRPPDEGTPDFSTDSAWEEWGRRDPYFGVITQEKFRQKKLTADAKREFFDSGRLHVDYVIRSIHRNIAPEFTPQSVLDFGCGVGRMLIPFARIAKRVVGLDVSPTMLKEARKNCDDHSLTNVSLLPSDDSVSLVTDVFDLVHSFIVFQHIPANRGHQIFRCLLSRIAPGGVGVIHVLYSKSKYAATNGVAPSPGSAAYLLGLLPKFSDKPQMQMNPYTMNELLFFMQSQGVQRCYSEFTDHGGELGILLFFAMPGRAPHAPNF
jgi:2-polyprenyl-3-methyl-5-hydroxy-6-metoxy-1,4-benzoquinol methylase